jgi:succinate dehydrogenase / fumarate reductase iron-sulfur subunit
MSLTLRIWRQDGPTAKGKMVTYKVNDISPDMSFLEMLDVLNERLIMDGDDPVAFDHDCREGICGMCGVMINGRRTGRSRPPPASCTCARSRTATRSTSSRGGRVRSR